MDTTITRLVELQTETAKVIGEAATRLAVAGHEREARDVDAHRIILNQAFARAMRTVDEAPA